MPADPEALRRAIEALWERARPDIDARLLQLARTAREAAGGTVDPDARAAAAAEAHKLTGSLGMFGFPEASEIARRVEQALDGEAPLNGPMLAAEVARIRLELGL